MPLRLHAGQTGIFGNTTVAQASHRLPTRHGVSPAPVGMNTLDGCNRFTESSRFASHAEVPLQRAEAGVEHTRHELLAFLLLAFLGLELRRPFAERAVGVGDRTQ